MSGVATPSSNSRSAPPPDADPLFSALDESAWVVVVGPEGSGRSERIAGLLPYTNRRFVTVSLRGVAEPELVLLSLAKAVGNFGAEPRALGWLLKGNRQGVVFDQCDALIDTASQPFRSLVEYLPEMGIPVVVVCRTDPGWADARVVHHPSGLPAPARFLPPGITDDDYRDLLAANPSALGLAGPAFAFDPSAVRSALQEIRRLPLAPWTSDVRILLAELALRRVGYESPEATALFHLLNQLPTGIDAQDRDALLGDAGGAAVDLLLRYRLALPEDGRIHVAVRLPVPAVPPLADVLRQRLEARVVSSVAALSDRIVSSDRSGVGGAEISQWLFFARNPLQPATAQALAVTLARVLAHSHCRTLALEIDGVSSRPESQSEPASPWSAMLRADLALAAGENADAVRWAESAGVEFEKAGDVPGMVESQLAIARARFQLGNGNAAVDASARALRTATKVDWKYGQAVSLRTLGHVSRPDGDPVAVRDAYIYASGLYESIGDRRGDLSCRISAAESLISGGWVTEALDSLVEILEDARKGGPEDLVPSVLVRLAELTRQSGDPHRAVLIADAAWEGGSQRADIGVLRLCLQVQRRCFCAIGYGEPALACTVIERDMATAIQHPDAPSLVAAVEAVREHFQSDLGPDFVAGALHRADAVRDDAVDRVRSLVALWELPFASSDDTTQADQTDNANG